MVPLEAKLGGNVTKIIKAKSNTEEHVYPKAVKPNLLGLMPEGVLRLGGWVNRKLLRKIGVQIMAISSPGILGTGDIVESKPAELPAVGIVGTSTLLQVLRLHWQNPYAFDLYRLLHLEDMVDLTRDVPGCIVECGTGSGNTLAMLALLSNAMGTKRQFWSYDSFEGLPKPTKEDVGSPGSLAREGGLKFGGIQQVLAKLRDIGLDEDTIKSDVKLVKGWFPDTLPSYDGPQIALLHADADLYESTMCILKNLWPKVAIGGVVVFDEYDNTTEWPGEKLAADEYFARNPNSVKLCRDRFSIRYHAIKLA